jgi:hypothetical protein
MDSQSIQSAACVGTKLALAVELTTELERRAHPQELVKLSSLLQNLKIVQHHVELCGETTKENVELLNDLQDLMEENSDMEGTICQNKEQIRKLQQLHLTYKRENLALMEANDNLKEEIRSTQVFRDHFHQIQENTKRRICNNNAEKLEGERKVKDLEVRLENATNVIGSMIREQGRVQLELTAEQSSQHFFEPLNKSSDFDDEHNRHQDMMRTRLGLSSRRPSVNSDHSSLVCPSILEFDAQMNNVTAAVEDSEEIPASHDSPLPSSAKEQNRSLSSLLSASDTGRNEQSGSDRHDFQQQAESQMQPQRRCSSWSAPQSIKAFRYQKCSVNIVEIDCRAVQRDEESKSGFTESSRTTKLRDNIATSGQHEYTKKAERGKRKASKKTSILGSWCGEGSQIKTQ